MFTYIIYFTGGQTQRVMASNKIDAISKLRLNNLTEEDIDFVVKVN